MGIQDATERAVVEKVICHSFVLVHFFPSLFVSSHILELSTGWEACTPDDSVAQRSSRVHVQRLENQMQTTIAPGLYCALCYDGEHSAAHASSSDFDAVA